MNTSCKQNHLDKIRVVAVICSIVGVFFLWYLLNSAFITFFLRKFKETTNDAAGTVLVKDLGDVRQRKAFACFRLLLRSIMLWNCKGKKKKKKNVWRFGEINTNLCINKTIFNIQTGTTGGVGIVTRRGS